MNITFKLLSLVNTNNSNAIINTKNQARTYLLLHEYVSMGLLQEFGIKVPKFKVASTPNEVKEVTASGGSYIISILI